MSISEDTSKDTLSEERSLGDENSIVFQIMNGVAPTIYSFGLFPSANSTDSELSSKIGIYLHSGNYSYTQIKKVCCNLVNPFIIYNIKEKQLIAMADKYIIKDFLFLQRESGVFDLNQTILSQLALDTAKWEGERFTYTKGELLNLPEDELLKVEIVNKQTYECLADNNSTETHNWHVRGRVKLFYSRLKESLIDR